MSAAESVDKLGEIIGLLKKLVETVETERNRPTFQRGIEYYEFDEQAALAVTPAVTKPHEFKEKPVRFLWLYAQGTAIRVSLDNAVSGESMIIPQGAIIWVKKKCRRVYGQAVAGAGNLYIWGFW